MNAEEFEKGVLGAIKAVDELQKSIPVGTVSYPSKLDDKYQEKLSWLGIARSDITVVGEGTLKAYKISGTNHPFLLALPDEAIRYEGNGKWEPMER